MRALIVEHDTDRLTTYFADLGRVSGLVVDYAETTDRARALLHAHTYDIVVTENRMPAHPGDSIQDDQGIEILDCMRLTGRHAFTKKVVLSGSPDDLHLRLRVSLNGGEMVSKRRVPPICKIINDAMGATKIAA